jgi:Asp/Glu/Hydantoin racemase
MTRAAILHTTPVTLAPLKELAAAVMPDVDIMNILDDGLLRDVMREGGPTPPVNARIAAYIRCAEAAGCVAFMTACSSIGGVVEACALLTDMSLTRIDAAMAEAAIQTGREIGVAATVGTTMKPTMELIERRAAQASRPVHITQALLPEAYGALIGGDGAAHDRIVLAAVQELMAKCQVVVLAQASMARALGALKETPVPILTSPELGMKRFSRLVKGELRAGE